MTDAELRNPDNWEDYGLTDHFEDRARFPDWISVAQEAARILDADEDSPMADLLKSLAAAAAKLGFHDYASRA